MVKKEMTYLYELAEFLLVSDPQTSADNINQRRARDLKQINLRRVHDIDIGKDENKGKKNHHIQMGLP